MVKDLEDELQILLKDIEDSATTPALSVTPNKVSAKVTEPVTFTAVLTGNANSYRDGNNTIKWQQNSNPQPDDKGWTEIKEAIGVKYTRSFEAGDANKAFRVRAVALDKAAGSKDLL